MGEGEFDFLDKIVGQVCAAIGSVGVAKSAIFPIRSGLFQRNVRSESPILLQGFLTAGYSQQEEISLKTV